MKVKQVIKANNWSKNIMQEIRASKPNANTKNFSEVRAPSSTSPPSPRRISNHYNFIKSYNHTGVPNSTISNTSISWWSKDHKLSFEKTFFPYKNPIEQCVALKLKYCKWKRKMKLREFWNKNFRKERFFSPKTENKTLLKAFKLWIFLQMIVVNPTTLITPIYRIELGIKE